MSKHTGGQFLTENLDVEHYETEDETVLLLHDVDKHEYTKIRCTQDKEVLADRLENLVKGLRDKEV